MLSVNDRTATEVAADEPGRFDGGGSVVVDIAEGQKAVISGDPTNKTVFANYLKVMDRADLESDPRFVDVDMRKLHRAELDAIIQEWVLTIPEFTELESILSGIHLPIGRIRTIRELSESDWAIESGAFVEVSDRHGGVAKIPQSPWRFSGATTGARGSAAYPGEHNSLIMEEVLGLSPKEIADLENAGTLRSRLPDNITPETIPSEFSGLAHEE